MPPAMETAWPSAMPTSKNLSGCAAEKTSIPVPDDIAAVIPIIRPSLSALGAPITIISEAVREVFRQRASCDYAKNGECRAVYRTTGKMLALAALVPFVLLMLGAVPAFSAIFGDKWRMAAYFIVMMSPFY